MTVDTLSAEVISPTAYLGKGLAWPPREDPATGDFMRAEAERSIGDCVLSLITTAIGEMSPLPEFGTRKDELLFGTGSASFVQAIASSIEDAITKFENRVRYVKTEHQIVERGATRSVQLTILYRIISTGELTRLTTNVRSK